AGAREPVPPARAPAEGEGPRFIGQERVGAGPDEEPAGPFGRDRAAEPVARLDQRQLERDPPLARHLHSAVRRRQPRDPSADHDEPHEVPRTSSASIAMKAGWSFTAAARWSASPCARAIARASTSRSYRSST